VTPLLDIGCTTVIKGPGCEPITPFILITIVLVVWFFLFKYIWISGSEKTVLACSLLSFAGFGLAFALFWTSFTNPGFVLRKRDHALARTISDSLYCTKCMVTFEEARNEQIVHCYDCDRCCRDYDHHCPVLGNCIGKKNIWSFYGVIVFFIVASMIAYFSMYLMLTSGFNNEAARRKHRALKPKHLKDMKITGVQDVINVINTVIRTKGTSGGLAAEFVSSSSSSSSPMTSLDN
jgi:hypothetical protein